MGQEAILFSLEIYRLHATSRLFTKKSIAMVFLVLNFLLQSLFFRVSAGPSSGPSSGPSAGPHFGDRHMLIIRSGIDKLFVNYVSVIEKGDTPLQQKVFEFPLLKNVLDFNPQEGLDKKDLTVNAKNFLEAPIRLDMDQKVVSLVYIVPAQNGVGVIEFALPYAIKELRVLIESSLKNESPDSIEKVSLGEGDFPKTYTPYFYKKLLLAQDQIVLSVSSVPTGRSRLYLMGGITAVLLALCSVVFTMKTIIKG